MRWMVLALFAAGPVWADDWMRLTGQEIQEALEGRALQYETAQQDFRASGRTLYNAGQDSWGYWNVRDDQYCSMWPPSDLWACYHLERSDTRLRFVGQGNDVTEAEYLDVDQLQ